jgi:multidrug resistance efflux pump
VLLAAELETTLSSQMNGTLGELKTRFGERVAKGATLARFNCNEAQARGKVAVAELAMARQNLEAKKQLRKLDDELLPGAGTLLRPCRRGTARFAP